MKSIYCVCLLTFSVRRLESVFAAWYWPGDVLVGGLYRRRRARPESRDPEQLAAHGILRMRHWPMRVEHPWSFSCFIGFLLQPFRLEIYEIKVFVWEDNIKSFWSLYQFWPRHTKGHLCFVLKPEKHSGGRYGIAQRTVFVYPGGDYVVCIFPVGQKIVCQISHRGVRCESCRVWEIRAQDGRSNGHGGQAAQDQGWGEREQGGDSVRSSI